MKADINYLSQFIKKKIDQIVCTAICQKLKEWIQGIDNCKIGNYAQK